MPLALSPLQVPCSLKSKLTTGSGEAGREREEVDKKETASSSTALAAELPGMGWNSGRRLAGTSRPSVRCVS